MIPKRKPDLSIAKNVLNWEANTDIDSGLDSTISYLQKHINKIWKLQ